jgi:seryl-tRNA synthetase
MIDITLLREHPEKVRENAKNKGYDVDIDRMLELDTRRRKLQTEADTLRAQRNDISRKMKSGGAPDPSLIEQGKAVKEKLAALEADLSLTEEEFYTHFKQIPNIVFEDVPVGGEEDSIEIKHWGDQKSGGVDHLEFASQRGWLDFGRGAKVAGTKFYFLKGDLALLENALLQFGLDFLVNKGFTYITVPHMVNARTATGAGFSPRSSEQSDEYFIEGEDLSLIATAEMPLTGLHADEIIDAKNLPLLYAGYSPCYRKEAGTYGKHTRGLFRVHQFNKLEMYAFCTPDQSSKIHEQLREIEEELWQSLEIPYRIINIATGDLGAPAAKKYDIEYWSPVDQKYRELTSCSNCTDFQTRNLNIRCRDENGKIAIAHSLNGTAIAFARSLVAIIEHFHTEDGKLRIPEKLRPYMRGKETI